MSEYTRPHVDSTVFAGSLTDCRPLYGAEVRSLFRDAIRSLETAPPVMHDGAPDLEATMDALMDALVDRLVAQQIVFSVAQPLADDGEDLRPA
jgi:hypothetical protein